MSREISKETSGVVSGLGIQEDILSFLVDASLTVNTMEKYLG